MAKTAKRTKLSLNRIGAKFPKKSVVYGLLVLALGLAIYFGGKTFFVASVNGRLISRLSVVNALEKQGGKKTLDVLIVKSLINQEAKKRKVSATVKEIEDELAKIEKSVTAQGSTLDAVLAQEGMTKDSLADEIRLQVLVKKMVGQDIKVSDKEIDDYIDSQREQMALLGSEMTAENEPSRDDVSAQLKQQKLQEKIQSFVADLKEKAKIKYFITY